MYQDIVYGKYKSKLPYPVKPRKPSTNVDVATASDADIATLRKSITDFEDAEKSYKKAMADYRSEEARLTEQFKADLFAYFEVTNNSRAELCYQKSWERESGSGLQEVFSCFEDLVELIK